MESSLMLSTSLTSLSPTSLGGCIQHPLHLRLHHHSCMAHIGSILPQTCLFQLPPHVDKFTIMSGMRIPMMGPSTPSVMTSTSCTSGGILAHTSDAIHTRREPFMFLH